MFCTQELRIGPTKNRPASVFLKSDGRKWVELLGYILKFGNKAWAWDSFKVRPYLSNTQHAETFASIELAKNWASKHKIVGQVTELVKDTGNPWPVI